MATQMAWAQFYAGYGAAYYPTGLQQLHSAVNVFNNNPELDKSMGSTIKQGKFMAANHGLALGWRSGNRLDEEPKTKLSIGLRHASEKAYSIRQHTGGSKFYQRIKFSSTNFFAGIENKNKRFLNSLISAWTLQGYAGNYTLRSSIGQSCDKGWDRRNANLDFGLDLGLYLLSNSRSRVYLHYSHSLASARNNSNAPIPLSYYPDGSISNASNFGLQVQVAIGKCRCTSW
jgi:hypothetical protein